jgi:hypothetical protein
MAMAVAGYSISSGISMIIGLSAFIMMLMDSERYPCAKAALHSGQAKRRPAIVILDSISTPLSRSNVTTATWLFSAAYLGGDRTHSFL